MTDDDKKNATTTNTPNKPVDSKHEEQSPDERELTEQEITAIAGGLNPQPLPPGGDPHDRA